MRRKLLFALTAIVLAFGLTLGLLFVGDLVLHSRASRSAGLNVWGYRGPVVSRKHDGEPRIAVLGGSTAFGYGVSSDEAYPAVLERALKASRPDRRWSVVNLGYNNEGAYSFRFTLEDFAYLKPDVVILYEGYNDIVGDGSPNTALYRHDSPVFMLTGYMPIFPLVFREKAMMLSHGSLDAGYASMRGEKNVFRPNLTARATASTLEAAASLGESIEKQLDRFAREPSRPAPASVADAGGCLTPWRHYCSAIALAIDYALAHRQKIIVAAQPRPNVEHVATRHDAQQRALADMLQRRFGGNHDVRYVSLAEAVDLHDPILAPDGMHLNPTGNRTIAEKLVQPVLDILGLMPAQADRR